MRMNGRPRVDVRKRGTYAAVEIDLWPCDFDLDDAGTKKCWRLLEDAALETNRRMRKKKPIYFAPGGTYIWIGTVHRDLADDLLASLLEVVNEPDHHVPLRAAIRREAEAA